MTPRRLAADELEVAATLLRGGALVAIPTDTVYGLAVVPGDDAAVAALFTAKRRPEAVPVALLCATTSAARAAAGRFDARVEALAVALWPGPLTIVVPADASLARRLGATAGVGLRVPDDATCAALLAATGPLAVTSANRHGAAPATTADEVCAAFADEPLVDAVVDAGPREGVVSTVVDLTGAEPVLVREGALPAAAVRAVLSAA